MDYRERKYYLIRLRNRNGGLKTLKEAVPSLKVHPPYNHFRQLKNNNDNYDGNILITTGVYKNGEADKLTEKFSEMYHPYNFIMELEKWNCKQ